MTIEGNFKYLTLLQRETTISVKLINIYRAGTSLNEGLLEMMYTDHVRKFISFLRSVSRAKKDDKLGFLRY